MNRLHVAVIESDRTDWWEPFVRPQPTWESTKGYHLALGLLASCPPSSVLTQPSISGYLAGLLEGEGYFYYIRFGEAWYPSVYLKMREKQPVKIFAETMNVKCKAIGEDYVARVKGLRTILLVRVIKELLQGKRRSSAMFFEEKGYKVTDRETIVSYSNFYSRRRRETSSQETSRKRHPHG